MKIRQAYLAISWIPLASLIVILLYLKRFDGWGSWGAAALFLPVILISGIMGIIGIILFIFQWQRGCRDFRLMLATFLSGSVSFYYIITGFQ
jgi:uncharacterized membrane protein